MSEIQTVNPEMADEDQNNKGEKKAKNRRPASMITTLYS